MKTNLAQQVPHAQVAGLHAALTPEGILQLGLGFWGSKTLLSAVELGVFTHLAQGPLSAQTLSDRLGLSRRGAGDFLDALVALGMLERGGAIPRLLISSSIATSRPMWADCWRWPTPGSIHSGVA
jgi:hypothetical protein